MSIICCVFVSSILSVFSVYPAASEHDEWSLAAIADRCRQKDAEHEGVLQAIRSHDPAYLSDQGRLNAHISNRYTGGATLLHVAVATLHQSKKDPAQILDVFAASKSFHRLLYVRGNINSSAFYSLCTGRKIKEGPSAEHLAAPLIEEHVVSPLELAVSYNNMPIIIALSKHIDFFADDSRWDHSCRPWLAYSKEIKNSLEFWRAMIEHKKIQQRDRVCLPLGFTTRFIQQLGLDAMRCLVSSRFDIRGNCSSDSWRAETPVFIFNHYYPDKWDQLLPLLPEPTSRFEQFKHWLCRSAV